MVEVCHIGLGLGWSRDTGCIIVHTLLHRSNVTACTEPAAFAPEHDHADLMVTAELL